MSLLSIAGFVFDYGLRTRIYVFLPLCLSFKRVKYPQRLEDSHVGIQQWNDVAAAGVLLVGGKRSHVL